MKLKEKLATKASKKEANPYLNEYDNYEYGFMAGFEEAKTVIMVELRHWLELTSLVPKDQVYCYELLRVIEKAGEEEND